MQLDSRNTMAGWCFSADEIERCLQGGPLLNPSLDLSNPCNLNCPYCYIEEKNSARKTRRPNELTHSELISLIEDFASAGAKSVNIVGAGEPTIDPFFPAIISKIADAGMIPVVFTNGVRLAQDIDLVKQLYNRNATVVLKFNALNPQIQDLVVGRKGYTAKRDLAFENLHDHGFDAHDPTRLAFDIIAFRGNLPDIPDIHRLCRRNSILPIIGDFIPTGRTESGHFVGFASVTNLDDSERMAITEWLQPLTALERQNLYEILAEIDENEFSLSRSSVYSPAYYAGGICTQILGLYVDILGNIWPCVARSQLQEGMRLNLPLGNTRTGASPSQIWRDHPYMRWIREHYTGGCPYKPPLADLVHITTPPPDALERREAR